MIKIFLDTADLEIVKSLGNKRSISGFTTNPTLMRKAGVKSYLNFAKSYLDLLDGKPLSLEVFADSESEMIKQAYSLSNLSNNIYVKIPIFFTNGKNTSNVIRELSNQMNLNITAVTNFSQLRSITDFLPNTNPLIISYFAGRVADAGHNFMEIAQEIRDKINFKNVNLLWASTREIYNLKNAMQVDFDIITITPDLFEKYNKFGKNLDEISIETVNMFYQDAIKSNFNLK